MVTFDRTKPYDISYGNCMAQFMQDGNYFMGDGTLLEPEDAGKEPTPELVKKYADRAKAAAPAADAKEAQRAKLSELTLKELTGMIAAAGGEPISGSGAKAASIEWLLENTEL